jgi:hypothetical protein
MTDVEHLLLAYEDFRDAEAGDELAALGVLEGRLRPRWAASQYAAWLVCRRFQGERAPEGGAYHVVASGERLQVRARKRHGRDPLHSTIHFDPAERDFDMLVWVYFDDDYRVREAWRLPWTTLPRVLTPFKEEWRLPVTGDWRGEALAFPL